MDLSKNDAVTPERAREIFEQVKRLRENKEKSLRLLAELEQAIAVKVGEHVQMHTMLRMGRKANFATRCARCGAIIGYDTPEMGVRFEGRTWHVRNCVT